MSKESSTQEHLDLLKEVASAGEDPRSVKWAAMRVRVDGTPSQIRMLQRIEERAAAVHDQPKGAKKTPPSALDESLARALGYML